MTGPTVTDTFQRIWALESPVILTYAWQIRQFQVVCTSFRQGLGEFGKILQWWMNSLCWFGLPLLVLILLMPILGRMEVLLMFVGIFLSVRRKWMVTPRMKLKLLSCGLFAFLNWCESRSVRIWVSRWKGLCWVACDRKGLICYSSNIRRINSSHKTVVCLYLHHCTQHFFTQIFLLFLLILGTICCILCLQRFQTNLRVIKFQDLQHLVHNYV